MKNILVSIGQLFALSVAILWLTPIPPSSVEHYTPSWTALSMSVFFFGIYVTLSPRHSSHSLLMKVLSIAAFAASAFMVVFMVNRIPW